jgi:hypothetical protein
MSTMVMYAAFAFLYIDTIYCYSLILVFSFLSRPIHFVLSVSSLFDVRGYISIEQQRMINISLLFFNTGNCTKICKEKRNDSVRSFFFFFVYLLSCDQGHTALSVFLTFIYGIHTLLQMVLFYIL